MKHLSRLERNQLTLLLDAGVGIRKIGRKLGRSYSTIAREIARNSQEMDIGAKGHATNRCALRDYCRHSGVCGSDECRRHWCRGCGKCNAVCADYREEKCERLVSSASHVCNGCDDLPSCVLMKRFYMPATAQDEYEKRLAQSRSGTRLSREALSSMDKALREGLANGQSVHHMVATPPHAFPVSEKTVYRLIFNGILPWVRKMDLPQASGRRPRGKAAGRRPSVPREDGRGYADYQELMSTNPELSVVEMDSVIGRVGGKCLFTLNFNVCGMMLAFLRPRNDAQSVVDCLDSLEKMLGPKTFRRLFQVALADNGSEFSMVGRMEAGPDGERRIGRFFFCDPYSSWQKGRVENNHLNLSTILTKGRSMHDLTQEDVTRGGANVNSMLRAEYNDIPAITAFEKLVGHDAMVNLGIALVPPGKVNLTPGLVGW